MKLFEILNIKNSILIESSLGGLLAQVIARSYAENIAGVCLYSTCSLSEMSLKILKKKYRAFALPFL